MPFMAYYEDPLERQLLLQELQGKRGIAPGEPVPGQTYVRPAGSTTTPATSLATSPLDLNDYQRRGGGTGGVGRGAVSGAATGAEVGNLVPGVGTAIGAGVGAVVGGIAGAFSKHAATARTDFTVADARDAIAKQYREQLGREASPAEIDAQLRAQGWHYGDRWVGQSGLTSVLNSIHNSDEAHRFATDGPAATSASAPAPPASGTDTDVYAPVAGFDFDKLSGKKPYDSAAKYSDAVRTFSKGLGSGVQISRGNLGGMIDYAKAHGFANAKAVGDDKIDFGDGAGPIDVITRDGGIWFQNGDDRFGGATATVGSGAATSPSSFSTIQSLVPTDTEFYNKLQAKLQQILGGPGQFDREALLRLLAR